MKPQKRTATDRGFSREEANKLKPASTPQAVWDALNDQLDRQDAVEYADLIKAIQEHEKNNPKAIKKAKTKRPKPKTR